MNGTYEARPVVWVYRKAGCQTLCSGEYLVNMTRTTGTDPSFVEQVLVPPGYVAVTIDCHSRHGPRINTSNEYDAFRRT